MAVRPGSGSIKCSTLAFTILVVATLVVGLLTPAAAVTPKTKRVSVGSTGAQATGYSWGTMSADGRFVAFFSDAPDLVSDDSNGAEDVFVRDRKLGTTTMVSVSTAGAQGNGLSLHPTISADGRFVAFFSRASNLVKEDMNDRGDVFVRDLWLGTTRRVSVSSAGTEANDDSFEPAISADGRFVAFYSRASNLVNNDTGKNDVFVRDRRLGTTARVSVSTAGAEGNGRSSHPTISADGRFVTFQSHASDLVENDRNAAYDVFVRDRRLGTTKRLSVSSAGTEANGASYEPAISADGRFVAFSSDAPNLVNHDTGKDDVFVRDRRLGTTRRVSESSAGVGGNIRSFEPAISDNGRFVAFTSLASNLVPNDTNHNYDVFVRDRKLGTTTRVSVSTAGAEANETNLSPSISANGRYVAFVSGASNLVGNDTNDDFDVFIRGPLH